MTKTLSLAFVGAAALMASTVTQASIINFFGEDLNNSAYTPLASTPNANAAAASFLSNLSGVGTETFEGFAAGTSAPLNLTFPGAGTATLAGGNGNVASTTPGTTNTYGRYAISGSHYWEVTAGGGGDFTVNFSQAIAAFGFYGIDIGDFGGQITLGLANGASTIVTVNNTVGSNGNTDGSVLFQGIIGTTASDLFTSVTFNTTTGQGDVFAFDNLTIGSLEQVTHGRVPVTGVLPLMGLAIGAMTLIRRKS